MDFVALGYEPEDVEKYIEAGSEDPGPTDEEIQTARKALLKDIYRDQSNLHEVCF